jgi:hypothetical protein
MVRCFELGKKECACFRFPGRNVNCFRSLSTISVLSIIGDYPNLLIVHWQFRRLLRLQGDEVATLGSLLPFEAVASDELRAFFNWALVIPMDLRAQPDELIEDDW